MLDWKHLAAMPEDELGRLDIAAVNLACAGGLPGGPTEEECVECLRRLDEYAARCAAFTDLARPKFGHKPSAYRNSQGYFRVMCMATALWKQCGVCYNEAKIPVHIPLDTPDVFVHGPILGKGGTCASLPVVYAAVGRRLGYPIKLVSTRSRTTGHLFARWDDPNGERFNIEVNYSGLSSRSDKTYRTGRYYLPREWEHQGGYLKSQSPRHEMAGFLSERGRLSQRLGDYRKATEALAWAASLVPQYYLYLNTLRTCMSDWSGQHDKRKPPGFPCMSVGFRPKRYPAAVPQDLEDACYGLEATENVLNDKHLDAEWWQPMREGRPLPRKPTEVLVDFLFGNCACTLSFRA